jgi:zinc protease
MESVTALTRDDLVAAHKDIFAKDRLYVGAVGDITPTDLGLLLDQLLGDLPETGAAQPTDAEVTIEGGVTVIEFDTPQSVALFGHKGIGLEHPDYFAVNVLNQVLGGGSFESRLMNEVREKRGLTYGVNSFLAPRDHAATYQGNVASANDRIAEAISVIRDEWAKASEQGVTPDELRDAKTYITGAYPLRFDGNVRKAYWLVGKVEWCANRNWLNPNHLRPSQARPVATDLTLDHQLAIEPFDLRLRIHHRVVSSRRLVHSLTPHQAPQDRLKSLAHQTPVIE